VGATGAPEPGSIEGPPSGRAPPGEVGSDGAAAPAISLRGQIGRTDIEVLPAPGVNAADDFDIELDGEAGGVTISLP